MPGDQRQQRIEELFHEVLEHGPDQLWQACGGDETLREEVESLLASYRDWSASLPAPAAEALPRFGAYQCVELIGVGGMGAVYRAERADGQFEQNVAIKVLRGALRSEWYRERFLEERRILASLTHPNIAQLLDGGMTPDGEPFLVMELAQGAALDIHCDRHKLSVRKRLELFDQILTAIDYAHKQLIVHRDLKPSNVMVGRDGAVKLLDFGTSKLIEEDATATSMRALTPRYASPEQLRGEAAGVASDVYSAGVLLFEMLTGVSPFGDSESVVLSLERASGRAEAADPEFRATAAAAELRSTTLPQLRKELKGDLGAILAKALAHEPAARYGSAKALREDLQRYRSGLPVEAKPATVGYRASRFFQRNRWGVAAAATLLAITTIGLVSTLWQARIAARRFADLRQFAVFVMADLNEGLQRLPGSTQLQRRSVERSLAYLDRLSSEAAADDALRVEIADGYRRLGDVLGNPFRANLGERKQAEELYRKGLAVMGNVAPSLKARRVQAELRIPLGATKAFGGQAKEGLEDIRAAVAELRALIGLDSKDMEMRMLAARGLDVLGTRITAGGGVFEESNAAEANRLFREAAGHVEVVLQADPNNAAAMRLMAQLENSQALMYGSSQPALALQFHRKGVAWLAKLAQVETSNIEVRRLRAAALSNTGWAEGQQGEYEAALSHLAEAKELLADWVVMDPANIGPLYQLSGVYRARGIIEGYRKSGARAVEEFSDAIAIHRKLSQRDPANKVYRFLRGELLLRSGNWLVPLKRVPEAEEKVREGLGLLGELAGDPQASLTHVFGACRWFAETQVLSLRDPHRAAQYCRKAMELTKGEDPDAFSGLALALYLQGDRAGAVANIRKALELIPPRKQGDKATQQRLELEDALLRFSKAPLAGGR